VKGGAPLVCGYVIFSEIFHQWESEDFVFVFYFEWFARF
jgi:hypothetical protein